MPTRYLYTMAVIAISYAPVGEATADLIARATDDAGAIDVYADDSVPPTERCPESPIVVSERPIVVELTQ